MVSLHDGLRQHLKATAADLDPRLQRIWVYAMCFFVHQ